MQPLAPQRGEAGAKPLSAACRTELEKPIMTNRIRMAVLATHAEGLPDLYLTFVEATALKYNEGQH
jgi:hypothetical protein